MKHTLLAVASALALVAPLALNAQALPDEVRNAGVTIIAWQSVQAEVRRSAAEKHVSEQALAAVCAKMGVQLARGHRLDVAQMITLIGGRADELNALTQKLALEEQQNNPAAAALLKRARAAIDAGDLDQAEGLLKQAAVAARSTVAIAQKQEAEITATDGEVKALQFDYLGAAAAYAEAADELPADDTHDRWTYILRQAGMLEKRGERFDEPQPLQDAVSLYRSAALPLVPRVTNAGDWGMTENNLGIALKVLGQRGDDQALHEAVTAFQAALEVRTRDRSPGDWAETEYNLGTALRVLGEWGDDQALHGAIAAYRAALEVDTRDRTPADWAIDQNSLGNALRVLGERGDDQALHDAVDAYRSALEVETRARDSADWAIDQNNLGIALRELGERGDNRALHEAVAAFRAALEVDTRDRAPAAWATIQNNLGNAFTALGQRGDDHALHDAVAAFGAALEVQARNRDPADWAGDQNDLGVALRALGERGDDQALHDAVAAFRAALAVWTPQSYPAYAKMAADNLARAEADLAKHGP